MMVQGLWPGSCVRGDTQLCSGEQVGLDNRQQRVRGRKVHSRSWFENGRDDPILIFRRMWFPSFASHRTGKKEKTARLIF